MQRHRETPITESQGLRRDASRLEVFPLECVDVGFAVGNQRNFIRNLFKHQESIMIRDGV